MTRAKLLMTAAASAVLAKSASAQLLRPPAAAAPAAGAAAAAGPSAVLNGVAPPPPLGLGVGPGAQLPGGADTIWARLGISQEQREFCRRKTCRTPAGQLAARLVNPLSTLTGGLIPPFCPTTPSIAELQDPGAIGAAAKAKLDRAGAEERIKAVKYLGTLDCHYWPEAEEALIAALRADRNECVRYEAAVALMSGCCCTCKVIAALSNTVTCSDSDGHPSEKSARVRAVAAHALNRCLEHCCVPCAMPNIMDMPSTPIGPIVPPVVPDTQKKADDQNKGLTEKGGDDKSKDAKPKDEKNKDDKTGDKKLKAEPGDPEFPKQYYTRVARLPREQVLAYGRRALEVGAQIGYTISNDVNAIDYAAAGLPAGPTQQAAKPTTLLEMIAWKDSGAAIGKPTPRLYFPLTESQLAATPSAMPTPTAMPTATAMLTPPAMPVTMPATPAASTAMQPQLQPSKPVPLPVPAPVSVPIAEPVPVIPTLTTPSTLTPTQEVFPQASTPAPTPVTTQTPTPTTTPTTPAVPTAEPVAAPNRPEVEVPLVSLPSAQPSAPTTEQTATPKIVGVLSSLPTASTTPAMPPTSTFVTSPTTLQPIVSTPTRESAVPVERIASPEPVRRPTTGMLAPVERVVPMETFPVRPTNLKPAMNPSPNSKLVPEPTPISKSQIPSYFR